MDTCTQMYIHIYIYIYESTLLWGPLWKHTKTIEKTMKTIGKPYGNRRNHRSCKSTELQLYLLSCMCVSRLMPNHLLRSTIPSRRHCAFVLPMSECIWTLTVYTTCLCHKSYKIPTTNLNITNSSNIYIYIYHIYIQTERGNIHIYIYTNMAIEIERVMQIPYLS